MAAKVFTDEELRALAVISLPKSYQRSRQIPLDPTQVFASYEDAEAYARGTSRFGDIAFAGQLVSVIDTTESSVTVYKIGMESELIEVGGVSKYSEEATNYSDAKSMATADNKGQIIDVAQEEEISGVTYSSGFYIVTGEGEIAKLGTTSASGDVEGDVENLKGRVGTLETNLASVSAMTEYLYWETDEDLVIE